LRSVGINTEVYFDDKKVKAKMKYASKVGVPYVILIGEDEINNNKLTVKNMSTGEQEQLTMEQIIEIIKL
jgi:histidyl-tRNA synthetase